MVYYQMEGVESQNRSITRYQDLEKKISARKAMYDAFERAREAADRARQAREAFEIHRATHEDALTLADEFIRTDEGKLRLKFEMQSHYGKKK